MTDWSTLKKLIWLRIIKGGGSALRTVTGALIHVTNALALPAEALTVNVEPIQAGTGDPSPDNVRPISGRTSATVTRTGVNIWDEEWEVGGINSSTGQNNNETNLIRSKNYIPVKPGMAIWVQSPDQGTTPGNLRSRYYDINKQYLGMNPTMNVRASTEIPDNCYFVRFACQPYYGTSYNNDISINYPATDTQYHPYAGNTYTITLGDTVYGGTLDVTVGLLTVDRAVVDLGTLAWGYESGTVQFYSNGITSTSINWHNWSAVPPLLCSQYKPISNAQLASSDFCVGYAFNSKQLRVKDTTYTDAATFKTAMSGVQLVYELATPLEITLTPQQIEMLLGENNLWADAGDLTLTYYADGNASTSEALGILLGGTYNNPGGADDVSDDEALEILLGGS